MLGVLRWPLGGVLEYGDLAGRVGHGRAGVLLLVDEVLADEEGGDADEHDRADDDGDDDLDGRLLVMSVFLKRDLSQALHLHASLALTLSSDFFLQFFLAFFLSHFFFSFLDSM